MKSLSTIGIIVCVVLLFTTDVVIANDTECNITIDKKCLVVPPVSENFVCSDAKPIDSLSMIWGGSQNIHIKAYKGSVDGILLLDQDNIAPGDEVTVSGFAGSPNDVYWEIFHAGTETKIGESTFHLSCSDDDMNGPEDCSKYEGDGKGKTGFINEWIFEGMAGNGLVLDCTPTPVEGADSCEFVLSPAPSCESLYAKPTSLTFRYTGADCSASDNGQPSDKFTCSGEPGSAPVSITIEKDPSKITVSPSSELNVGDLVTVSAIGSDMGSEIQLYVGAQFLKIHTSCSQPLATGDVFGSLELVQFKGQSSGAEVTYFYEVTNNRNKHRKRHQRVLTTSSASCSHCPHHFHADKSLTLEASALINETTTNVVTVNNLPCATDQVTVTVTVPTYDVTVDIKPGSYPNSINPRSKGTIPVAILSSMDFDAPTEVDTESLTFGPTGDEESLAFCSPSSEDVNDDGYVDLVCHFYTQMTGFECGDEKGILKGQTVDETPVEGSESVRIVPSACR